MTFRDLNLNKPLLNAIDDLGYESPTPIQEQTFSIILSGKDIVGIAQTGTGKTYAYALPVLKNLPFSKQDNPRVLILVPTRELVVQITDEIEKLAKYRNVRIQGVYGACCRHVIYEPPDILRFGTAYSSFRPTAGNH